MGKAALCGGGGGKGGFHQQAVASPSQTDPNVMHPKLPGSIFVVRWCHQPCFSFSSGTDSAQKSSLGPGHRAQPRRPSMPTGTLSRSLPLSPAYLCIPLCSLSSTRPWFLGRFDLLALPASFPFFSYWWPMTSPLAGLKEQLPSHLSSPSPGHPPRKWQLQTEAEPYAIYCRVL